MTTEQAIEKYELLFGKTSEGLGFSLNASVDKGGIYVEKWYSRNDFHCELEDTVFIKNNGKVYRNGFLIMENIDKEKIVAESLPLKELVIKLKLEYTIGKTRKNALNPYKAFVYNDWDDGGYVKRNVYKFEDKYYF